MPSENLAREVGKLVRQLRHEASYSQEEFALRCGLHRTYIGSIERGEKNITVTTAYKIAEAFGLSLSEFFSKLDGGE